MIRQKYTKELTHHNKMFFVILSGIVVVLAAILFAVYYSNTYGKNATVFTIDGEPVSRIEFTNIMSGLRSDVFQYFVQKYGARDSTKFWTTSFKGEIPVEMLRQKTLDKLKRIKTEQIVLKKNGIVSDISYNGFLQNFTEENKRRKIALEKNQPFYGPEQYEEMDYYYILQGNRVEELKNKLAKNVLCPSENEIEKFYNDQKEQKFKIDKSSSGYMSLEDVRQQIKNELVNKKYEVMIESLLGKAKVIINENVYKHTST
jgi:hypothetical protein